MKKITEFIMEIVIFFLGTLISIISLFIGGENVFNYPLIIMVITLSTDIICITLKFYIKNIEDINAKKTEKQLKDFLESSLEVTLRSDYIDNKWKKRASQFICEFKKKMQELYEGDLTLNYEEIFLYQNDLIRHTHSSLDAIHIATTADSLQLWDPQRSEDSKFKRASFYACKELNKHVKKRRLFVLNKTVESNNKELFDRVICSQRNDLGFEVKKVYLEDIKFKTPLDMIICDEEEIIEIDMRYGHVHSAHTYINKDKVKETVDYFNALWKEADDFKSKSSKKTLFSGFFSRLNSRTHAQTP